MVLFIFIKENIIENINKTNKIIKKSIIKNFFNLENFTFLSIVYLFQIQVFQTNTNINLFFCKGKKKEVL